MGLYLKSLLSAVGGLLLAAPAAVAQEGEKVGENLGDLLGGWASSLFVGIAALISLIFLLNRKYNELAIFVVAAVVVGGFVLAPDAVASTVKDIWDTITG